MRGLVGRFAKRPTRKRPARQSSWITDRTLPAGSLNHAIGGPSPRKMPLSSCSASVVALEAHAPPDKLVDGLLYVLHGEVEDGEGRGVWSGLG